MKDSKFDHFLESVLVLSQVIEKKSKIVERREYSDDSVKILRCVFSECINSDKGINGGAIFVENSNSIIMVVRSTFRSCRTMGNGGGIFAKCESILLNMTCYDNCRAALGDHSFFVSADNAVCSFSHIFECGYKKGKGPQTFSFNYADLVFEMNNVSSNKKSIYGTGLNFLNCTPVAFRLCHISNNIGNGLFRVLKCDENSKFDSCNIVNNSVYEESSLITFQGEELYLRKFLFFQNEFSQFYHVEEGSVIVFAQCKFDFEEQSIGSNSVITIKKCKFDVSSVSIHSINGDSTIKCYNMGNNDIEISTILEKTPSLSIAPTPTPSAFISPTVNMIPPGMIFREYGLIIFAAIVIPIFIVIHCISTKGIRNIRALN